MAVESFKNITMSFEGIGLKAIIDDVTVKKYATSLKGLTLEQANLALSTTQLSATEKERVLVEAGLIAQTEALTATDAVYRLQQKLGNDLSAEEILIRAGLVTQKEIEDGITIELTADKLKEALATGKLSLENYKLIASIFGVEGANYGATVSFEVLTKAIKKNLAVLGKFLFTNPAGWAILAGAAIVGVIAGVDAYNKKIQEGINAANEAKSATQEQIDTLDDYKNKIEELRTSLKNGNLTQEEAYDARKKLIGIQDELSSKYDIEKSKIDLLNGSLKEQIGLLDETSRQKAEDYLRDNKDAINNAVKNVEKTTKFRFGFDYSEFEGLRDLQSLLIRDNLASYGEYTFDSDFIGTAEEAIKNYQELYDYVLKYKEENAIVLKENKDGLANIDIILGDISNQINKINNEDYKNSKDLYDTAIQYLLVTNDNYTNLYLDSLRAQDDYYEAVASNNEEAIKKSLEDMKTAQANYQNALDSEVITDNGVADWFEKFYNDFIIESQKYQFKVDVGINVDNIDTALKIAFAKINKENPTALDIKNLEFSTDLEEVQAFESLTYIATQYGMTLEELIPILEDLGYVQKAETKSATDSGRTLEDLQKAYDELSKSASSYVSNQKSITSALEEQENYGQLSAKTIQELTDTGYAQALVIDKETGAVTLNMQEYEKLNKQKRDTIKLAAEQQKIELEQKYNDERNAISDLTLEMKYANEERKKAIELELAQHGQNMTEYADMIDKINGSLASLDAPTFGDGKEEKPDSVVKFEAEYARRQHEINMGRMKEDEDYYKWLESAAKTAFEGLEDYQDDLWKYEEEVYKGRKQLADDFYDSQRDYYKDRVSDLEAQIEITTKDSTDNNGNLLNAEEKFAYIRSVYSDILATIQEDINDIVQNGIEGHEDDLKELEQQYEKYVREMADVFKDEVESEIDYIQDLQDTAEKAYDDKIDKIEAEKKAMEDRYDAEIDKIDSVIDSIESKNKSEKLTNDLIKARQDLEKANRNKRLVFDSMGNQKYVADTKAVSEAQQAVKEAEQAITVNKLEEVKKAIEDEKTVLSESYDNQLAELKDQKEKQKDFYDNLVKTLQDYLNPNKQTESNTNVWNTVAGEDGAVKVGDTEMSTSYIDSRISSEDAVKEIYKKMLEKSGWSDTDIDKVLKDYDITKLLTTLASNNYKAMGVNEALSGNGVNNAQSYVNNNRNVTFNVTNDITISGNETDGRKIANEIIQEMTRQLPNAFTQQMYRNN